MDMKIYTNTSDPRALNKKITQVGSFSVTLKNETEIENPVILVAAPLPPTANYAYIPTLGRYYYIEQQNIVPGKLIQYNLRVDVLMSHKNTILQSRVIATRSTSSPNKSLPDVIPISANRNMIYKLLRNSSTVFGSDKLTNVSRCYLLTVAAGGV